MTDAQLGGQIAQTGWDQTIARTAGYDIGSIIDALVRNDHQREQANELLTRVHLVRLPWNLAPATTKSLQDCYSINPTAAGLILSSLLGDLTGVAANQRSTAADRPERRGINDLDTLVQATMSAIDVDGLETAVRLGICEIADFMSGPGTGLDDFLLGVDVVPSHIGADYDVIRPGSDPGHPGGHRAAAVCAPCRTIRFRQVRSDVALSSRPFTGHPCRPSPSS